MKRLMFISITLMCLSITLMVGVHIGHQTANAQGVSVIAAVSRTEQGFKTDVYMENGDWYQWDTTASILEFKENIFQSTAVESSTWGQLKSRYVEEKN